jgi:osmotically-inducible protein OsmY
MEDLIEVEVENGKVTLSGSVGSLHDKRRANRLAWVAGVNQVDDISLDVKWWAEGLTRRDTELVDRSDEEVAKSIEDALYYDPRTLSFKIDAEVDEGVATLTGTVDNLEAKSAAEEDAQNTVGVWLVRNKIKVRPINAPADMEIAQDILEAFERDFLLNRFDFTVTVINGKARLYGTVDDYFQKERAERVASRVFGVVEVENNVEIRDKWSWESDSVIKKNIEWEYFWSMLVDADDISVAVDHGLATLNGEVDTWAERNAAVRNAFEGGAEMVQSLLKVGTGLNSFYDNSMYNYQECPDPYWCPWP